MIWLQEDIVIYPGDYDWEPLCLRGDYGVSGQREIGPSNVRGDAVSPQERDVMIGAVATREETHWLQVGLPMQGGAFEAGRY